MTTSKTEWVWDRCVIERVCVICRQIIHPGPCRWRRHFPGYYESMHEACYEQLVREAKKEKAK